MTTAPADTLTADARAPEPAATEPVAPDRRRVVLPHMPGLDGLRGIALINTDPTGSARYHRDHRRDSMMARAVRMAMQARSALAGMSQRYMTDRRSVKVTKKIT